MAAAMAPDIVEELEGHPDPFLKVTAHPVVVVDARPHRRSRGSEPPAAMKRERPDERLNVIRELAGQQAREVVRVVERRDEGPIRRMASAEHRLGAPTHVPTQRTIGPLDSMQSVEEMENPNRDLRRDPSPSEGPPMESSELVGNTVQTSRKGLESATVPAA